MSTIIDVDKLDFAFQPIVNSDTGTIYAVEALIRNTQELGFDTIQDFFDKLNEEKLLFKVDIYLREKAIKKFKTINLQNLKLFYNIDNRILTMPDFSVGKTSEILEENDLPQEAICFEITEHHSFNDESLLKKTINTYKKNHYNIAIDDFGTGISGLHLLYVCDADLIKIDRFFIQNINKDSKKRLFCSSIIEMAHIMGLKVIAEGIETIEEYYTCKDIKVDFVQGYLISKPTKVVKEIRKSYSNIKGLFKKDRRNNSNNSIDKNYIDKIEPLDINTSLHDLIIYFKDHTNNTFVPIINKRRNIIGVIYEIDIKQISYSQYGLSLAKNSSFNSNLESFIKPVLEIDLSWGIDKALEIFHMQNNSKGIFVSKNSRYYGFINLNNLLSLSYKRNLEIAENKNPLTKLPGNNKIDTFINNVFHKNLNAQIVYFDFNDFKPFNDYYGFRQGDRAILLFAELLQKYIASENLISHIGGDDFCVGFINQKYEDIYKLMLNIQNEFKNSITSLYFEKDLEAEGIRVKDRYGIIRDFSFLCVSCAIIEINHKSSVDSFNLNLGNIKKESKELSYPYGICISM